MAEKNSAYSQRSAKKTLVFVIILLGVAVVLAFLAIYLTYKQSSVMTQSTYFENVLPATGSSRQ